MGTGTIYGDASFLLRLLDGRCLLNSKMSLTAVVLSGRGQCNAIDLHSVCQIGAVNTPRAVQGLVGGI